MTAASPRLARRPDSVSIDGVAFDSVTEVDVVDRVMSSVEREAEGGLILTANVDILRQLRGDAHASLADSAQMVVADGMPVVWASRLQGEPLPERVSGADLVFSLSQAAAEQGRSVFFLGSAPGVGARAAANLQDSYPGLEVAGCVSPPPGFSADPLAVEAVVESVAQAAPDIVFVALGFPRQERLALALRLRLPRTWFLGCGGALDMACGDVPRASVRLQKLGIEWMHRLVQEPRRLVRRYLRDDVPYALTLLARSAVRRWTIRDHPPALTLSAPETPARLSSVAFEASISTPTIPAQRMAEQTSRIDLGVPDVTRMAGLTVPPQARLTQSVSPLRWRVRRADHVRARRKWYRRSARMRELSGGEPQVPLDS